MKREWKVYWEREGGSGLERMEFGCLGVKGTRNALFAQGAKIPDYGSGAVHEANRRYVEHTLQESTSLVMSFS